MLSTPNMCDYWLWEYLKIPQMIGEDYKLDLPRISHHKVYAAIIIIVTIEVN